MKSASVVFLYIGVAFCLTSCQSSVRCSTHFVPGGFTGKVTIFFNQDTGQKEYDKNGCIVFRVGNNGNCYSAFPPQQGAAEPNKTYRFFEVAGVDSLRRIFEFYESDYLVDSANYKDRKYVFFHSSGYAAPYYTWEYYIDYGRNYKKHFYYP